MDEVLLSHEKLHQAFEFLAEECAKRGVVGEVHVFGGAAMVLAFHSRLATRDAFLIGRTSDKPSSSINPVRRSRAPSE